MKYVLSYGGGVNSSALFFYLMENKKPLDLVLFADTGEELKETYDSVERMKNIAKMYNIEFVVVKSKYGKLYDYYYNKKFVMSVSKRDCTGKFKIAPMKQYLRGRFGKEEKFVQYIGIAYDEMRRVTTSDVKYIELSYPFVDDKITREGNEEILKRHNFVATKSGCIGCPFQSKYKWVELCKTDLQEYMRWERLEKNNSDYPKILLNVTWKLEYLREMVKRQTSLKDFKHDYEDDLVCSETRGGCFL